jgi:hypothetical protein
MAEHIRAGGKPVQENHRGSGRVAGLAVEEPVAVDAGVSMMNSRHDIAPESM